MNSLDDLIRDTLTERARDVDHLDLTKWEAGSVRVSHRGRWMAIGAVAVLAAAILVAVVVVGPWRDATHHDGRPAAVPTLPAGMQWVSFHGITLTVPAEWRAGVFPCFGPTTSAVVVPGAAAYSCPAFPPNQLPDLSAATVVHLSELTTAAPVGDSTIVGGQPARRLAVAANGSQPAYVQLQLPTAGVLMIINAPNRSAEQQVLNGLAYTPVDYHGCAASLRTDPVRPSLPPGPISLTAPVTGVICEYEQLGSTPALTGSRMMDDSDVQSLTDFLTTAVPWSDQNEPDQYQPNETDLFKITTAAGTNGIIAVEQGVIVEVSDGIHRARIPEGQYPSLPAVYRQ